MLKLFCISQCHKANGVGAKAKTDEFVYINNILHSQNDNAGSVGSVIKNKQSDGNVKTVLRGNMIKRGLSGAKQTIKWLYLVKLINGFVHTVIY